MLTQIKSTSPCLATRAVSVECLGSVRLWNYKLEMTRCPSPTPTHCIRFHHISLFLVGTYFCSHLVYHRQHHHHYHHQFIWCAVNALFNYNFTWSPVSVFTSQLWYFTNPFLVYCGLSFTYFYLTLLVATKFSSLSHLLTYPKIYRKLINWSTAHKMTACTDFLEEKKRNT